MEKTTLNAIYQNIVRLFDKAKISFQSWDHESIIDFETDARIAEALGWTAEPTKSLFLKLKDGRHLIFLTHRDHRMDSKKIKQLLNSRPSMCRNEQIETTLGCVPGAVSPFGHSDNILLVIDRQLLTYNELMFTPGHPELTFAFAAH
ncbi:YbaK/EbsC family protein, partial [Endozoicomonas sp.]|nr:YbaK/EbsC family protein [Endozoicomonas sp.]